MDYAEIDTGTIQELRWYRYSFSLKFKVDDLVWLKLRNIEIMSRFQKLDFWCLRPFMIMNIVKESKEAFELKLLLQWHIYSIFYASLKKVSIRSITTIQTIRGYQISEIPNLAGAWYIEESVLSWMTARQPAGLLQGQLQGQLETESSSMFIKVHPVCRFSLACNNKDNSRTQSLPLGPNFFLTFNFIKDSNQTSKRNQPH